MTNSLAKQQKSYSVGRWLGEIGFTFIIFRQKTPHFKHVMDVAQW
ncbi:hypothetical protein [Ectobacillus funiculus]|uniref:DUF559 domain-containing protein n=1 Tax=Ectobacillus funiculus TaxID=137993 RepID=A0ABV5WJA3_9BACI